MPAAPHAASTHAGEPPSCAITAVLRNTPVPMIVPTTIDAEAHGPRSRRSAVAGPVVTAPPPPGDGAGTARSREMPRSTTRARGDAGPWSYSVESCMPPDGRRRAGYAHPGFAV